MLQTTNIEEQDIVLREAAFYEKHFYFSFSSGNKLLETPKEFYRDYVLREREIKRDAHLVQGTLTHFFTLEGVDFRDFFVVAPEGVPSGKGQEVIEYIFKVYKETKASGALAEGIIPSLSYFSDDILEAMVELDFYQNLKDDKKDETLTGDSKRLAKMLTPKFEEYFKFLIESQESRKELVDSSMVDLASKKADVLLKDEFISDLMAFNKENTNVFKSYNEFDHKMELDDYKFGLQGKLDNMVVDAVNKTIYINDLKTTGGKLQDFPESAKKWNYGMQAAVYLKLAKDCVKAFADDSWTFIFHFVVIDRANQAFAFRVSDESLEQWTKELAVQLDQINYHYTEKKYNLPYAFLKGDMVL